MSIDVTIDPANPRLVVRTPVFRMSYPNLMTPRPYTGKDGRKGPPRFSLDLLLDPESMGKFLYLDPEAETYKSGSIGAMVQKLANAKWGAEDGYDFQAWAKSGAIRLPLVSGAALNAKREKEGKKASDTYKDGVWVLKTGSPESMPPSMYVVEAGAYRELDRAVEGDKAIALKRFVGGHYAKAGLTMTANQSELGRFVTAYLNGVVFHHEGQAFGGRDADSMFGGIEGGETDYDPTGGLSDEIPF